MKVYEILVDDVFLGVVLDEKGSHSSDDALSAWNSANPSYQGDTARETRFVTL